MNTQTLSLAFLATVAVGGVAWVFIYPLLSGERKAENRRASVAKSEPAAKRQNEKTQRSGVPFVDNVPFLNVLFKREAELRETESLVILITARIIILRDEEKKRYNTAPK